MAVPHISHICILIFIFGISNSILIYYRPRWHCSPTIELFRRYDAVFQSRRGGCRVATFKKAHEVVVPVSKFFFQCQLCVPGGILPGSHSYGCLYGIEMPASGTP